MFTVCILPVGGTVRLKSRNGFIAGIRIIFFQISNNPISLFKELQHSEIVLSIEMKSHLNETLNLTDMPWKCTGNYERDFFKDKNVNSHLHIIFC